MNGNSPTESTKAQNRAGTRTSDTGRRTSINGGGEIRLQKVLAQAGVASRRRAEELILAGRVTVNGAIVTALGSKVKANDAVTVDGRPLSSKEILHYYVLHKPAGVITSAGDPQGRPTVLSLMAGVPVRVYPVGRLDYTTSGLLLLTNDGELAFRLTHPRFGVPKTYLAWVKGPVSNHALDALRRGVALEDGKTAPAQIRRLPAKGDLECLEITIHEGRNRQVRRMCEAVGHPVSQLQRIRFGPVNLEPQLKPGAYRALTAAEVRALRRAAKLN